MIQIEEVRENGRSFVDAHKAVNEPSSSTRVELEFLASGARLVRRKLGLLRETRLD